MRTLPFLLAVGAAVVAFTTPATAVTTNLLVSESGSRITIGGATGDERVVHQGASAWANRPFDARFAPHCSNAVTPFIVDCAAATTRGLVILFDYVLGDGNDTVDIVGPIPNATMRVQAGPGRDVVTVRGWRGTIQGGSGNDTINAKDGQRQTINCGEGGADVVNLDWGLDELTGGCEIKQ
jgi:hypothetical protein